MVETGDRMFDADKILREADLKLVAAEINANKELILAPLYNFKEYKSLEIPGLIRIGEMGSSQHNAMVFDLKYRDKRNNNCNLPVVVKRFDSEGLEQEVAAYRRLTEVKAEFPYFFNVAFYLQSEKDAYFATSVEPNLIPLSSMVMTVFREARNQEELAKNFHFYVAQGVISLLRLHRVGIKHGDGYLKNIGTNTFSNRFFAFDFELSEVTKNSQIPIDQDISLTEIRYYLDRCLRFAVEGDMTDGKTTPQDELRQIRKNHKTLLDKIGVTDPKMFMDIKLDILEKIYELYDNDFIKPGWSSNLEIKTSLKLLGRYPSDNGVDYDEFITRSIGNTGSLGLSGDEIKLLRKSA